MEKKFALIALLVILSGCTSLEKSVNGTVKNLSLEIIGEVNKTLSNISSQIGSDLSQGMNDSINRFISSLINITLNVFPKSPVSEFNEADINLVGISCSGSDEEIAECIKIWQVNNMDYGYSHPDISYSMRWNYAFPGIYPSNEIIREKTINGRIYGVCFDFAVIYCSIADYYGLDCRVMNSITKPSDKDSSLLEYATGLGMEEYDALSVKLQSKGLNYPYELVRQIVRETPEHYWAEVKLNDEWVIYDATNAIIQGSDTKTTYVDANDYEITQWYNLDTLEILKDYSPKSDDLGQTDRSWTIDDYFGSKNTGRIVPVPYYNSCTDVCDFFQGQNPMCQIGCQFSLSFYSCYESCASADFYKICDFVCSEEEDLEACYNECSGEELNFECYNNC